MSDDERDREFWYIRELGDDINDTIFFKTQKRADEYARSLRVVHLSTHLDPAESAEYFVTSALDGKLQPRYKRIERDMDGLTEKLKKKDPTWKELSIVVTEREFEDHYPLAYDARD